MARGDFQAAWEICDAVLAARPGPPDDPRLPYHLRWVWDGRPIEGRRVLVRCYHGLGDTLQFVRFLPALRRRAAFVTLEAQPELLPLLDGFPGVDRLAAFDPARPLKPAECDIEIMELGHALRANPCPYPTVWPALRHLPECEGAGVAVCAKAGDWDPERSVPPDLLRKALGGRAFAWVHRDPGDPFADIRFTAARIARSSLVITADTMIAHLSGALGNPTWLLLKARPDWRWLQPGRASRWYPATRLYRQRRPGDWSGPLAEIAADLRRRPSLPAGVHAGRTRYSRSAVRTL